MSNPIRLQNPLPLTAEQARAYAAGLKWQHRVPVEPQPFQVADRGPVAANGNRMPGLIRLRASDPCLHTWDDACPFGRAGDTLAVDGCDIRPVVTDVRIERVQDIDHRGCVAEGWPGYERTVGGTTYNERDYIDGVGTGDDAAIEWFADLWDSIHGPGAWERNDWCWCLSFKRDT